MHCGYVPAFCNPFVAGVQHPSSVTWQLHIFRSTLDVVEAHQRPASAHKHWSVLYFAKQSACFELKLQRSSYSFQARTATVKLWNAQARWPKSNVIFGTSSPDKIQYIKESAYITNVRLWRADKRIIVDSKMRVIKYLLLANTPCIHYRVTQAHILVPRR